MVNKLSLPVPARRKLIICPLPCRLVHYLSYDIHVISVFIVFADENPNLVNLISFPGKSGSINIPQQISTKYFMFGVLILNDETGAEVSAIVTKYHEDAAQINLEILRLWIGGRGKPLSWNILIGVLKEIGLDTLASDIKNGLH